MSEYLRPIVLELDPTYDLAKGLGCLAFFAE
jgi:hypothetical protein